MQVRRLYGGVVSITGVVLAVVQILHAVQESTNPVVIAVNGGPMAAVALALAFTGARLARDPVYEPDLLRILGWTTGGVVVFVSFAALTLFGENVATGGVARAEVVAVDNLTMGATTGVLVGLYDARGQHRRRQLEQERDQIESFASKAADVNNYGRAIAQASDANGVSAFCIEAVSTLLGFGETAVVEIADDSMHVVGSTLVDVERTDLRKLVDVARDQELGDVVVHEDGSPVDLGRDVNAAVTVHVADRDGISVVLVSVTGTDQPVEDEDRQLLGLIVSHAGTALEAL